MFKEYENKKKYPWQAALCGENYRPPFNQRENLLEGHRPNFPMDADGKRLLHLPPQCLRATERHGVLLCQNLLISERALRRRWIIDYSPTTFHEKGVVVVEHIILAGYTILREHSILINQSIWKFQHLQPTSGNKPT